LKSNIKSNIFYWFYLFPYCSLLWVSDIQWRSKGGGLGAAGPGRHFKGGGTSLTKNEFLKGV